MIFSLVLSRKDDKVIGLKLFGVVCDGMPALGMNIIPDLSHCCGILPSARDLSKIFCGNLRQCFLLDLIC